jgi:4-hydroxy-tetrahydrodipicolinate synthase
MVTPFSEDGARINREGATLLARALIESGTQSLVVAGTTGEGPSLSAEEKLELFRVVKDAIGDGNALIAGTGSYNTHQSIELTREAESYADAFLLTVPYYVKPTQEGIYQHFKAIAEVTGKPCILYNIPARTGVNMTAETTIRLSRIDNVAGIKEASGDLSQIARILDGAGPSFHVWSGNDEDTYAVVSLGGYGVIGVITHLVGLQVLEMVDLIRSERGDQAALIHRRLLPLRDAMFSVTSPIPIKWTLRRLGVAVGPLRLPLVEPQESDGERIWNEVSRHHLDLHIQEPVKA